MRRQLPAAERRSSERSSGKQEVASCTQEESAEKKNTHPPHQELVKCPNVPVETRIFVLV